MSGWSRYAPDKVIQVGWRTITRKHFVLPDGTRHEFDTIEVVGKQVVAVVALTTDNQVIIAQQFRSGPEKLLDELPGGMVEAGEQPVDAVVRELLEETGYVVGKIEPLGLALDDGYSNIERHYFFASECTQIAAQTLEAAEDVHVKLISVDELLRNARQAKMTDLLAVFYAQERLELLQ